LACVCFQYRQHMASIIGGTHVHTLGLPPGQGALKHSKVKSLVLVAALEVSLLSGLPGPDFCCSIASVDPSVHRNCRAILCWAFLQVPVSQSQRELGAAPRSMQLVEEILRP
ncbi:unnamed protein product, partial [Polarella glacialis]